MYKFERRLPREGRYNQKTSRPMIKLWSFRDWIERGKKKRPDNGDQESETRELKPGDDGAKATKRGIY